jgi:hypothetical protein
MATSKPSASEYYEAIGRLIVLFEHCVEQMRMFNMHLSGLFHSTEGQWTARTFMHRMTARELGEVCRTLFTDLKVKVGEDRVVTPSKEDLRAMEDLAKRWITLCEKRNEAVHSTWFIGWGKEGRAPTLRWRRAKDGLTPHARDYGLDDFAQLGDEAKDFANLLAYVQGGFLYNIIALRDGKNPSHLLANQIAFDRNGHVLIPEGRSGSVTPP